MNGRPANLCYVANRGTRADEGSAGPGSRKDAPLHTPDHDGAQDLNPAQPEAYPRRVLVAVSGLSPQVVTETLYALAVSQNPPFIPTEIHLLTTAEGAERARLSLLHPKSGWFHRLRRDYGLPPIVFDETRIEIVPDEHGAPLSDVRTPADNVAAADAVTEAIRRLTEDPGCALHASIAGGRKTLGFYLGYALSLYGRSQDRLSHVLVAAPYESHPQFFYPTPDSDIIHTPAPDSRPYDTRDAEVTLAEIPFVRLRHGLDEALLSGQSRFSTAVAAAQRSLGPPKLLVDLSARRLLAGGIPVPLPPVQIAFYGWLARRVVAGAGPVVCPRDGVPEADYANAFLDEYRAVIGPMGDDERTASRLNEGMDKAFFEETKSRVNHSLRRCLGPAATPYLIQRFGPRRQWAHGLALAPAAVQWGAQVPASGGPWPATAVCT